jgi:hypothetical protein
MTVTRWYIISFLIYTYWHTYMLHISIYLSFITRKLQTFFSVARTLIYQAPHSWVWKCAVYRGDLKCSVLWIPRSLHLMRQSLMCVRNTNQSFLSSISIASVLYSKITNCCLVKWTHIEFSVLLCSWTMWPFMYGILCPVVGCMWRLQWSNQFASTDVLY